MSEKIWRNRYGILLLGSIVIPVAAIGWMIFDFQKAYHDEVALISRHPEPATEEFLYNVQSGYINMGIEMLVIMVLCSVFAIRCIWHCQHCESNPIKQENYWEKPVR